MGKGDKDAKKEEEEKFPDLRYGPLDYSLSKILSYLNEEQTATLQAFRESIPTIWPEELTGVEKVFLTDATLCRYLRAREWNLGKAQKMLVETLKWRREYKPWAITAQDVDVELNNPGKLYRSGFDKYQRPILIMKPRKDNTGNEVRDIKVKYLVYCLEKCIRAGETQDREKISLLIDYSKYSNLTGLAMIRMSMDVLKILSDHYPERLGSAWMVHASWSFSFFWKTISPFLDNVTKKKIFFIGKLPELKDWIDDDILEVEYGGQNEEEYNYEIMKEREDRLFPPHNEEGELVKLFEDEAEEEEVQEKNAESEGDEQKKEKKKKSKKKKSRKHLEGDASSANAAEDTGEAESSASAAAQSADAPDTESVAESAAEASDVAVSTENSESKEHKKSKKSKKSSRKLVADADAAEEVEQD